MRDCLRFTAGFQCANNQYWDPLDGVAGQCVDQSACSAGAGNDLPPGVAPGRPFLSAETVPMFAGAVEQAVSDWVGMVGPDGKHNRKYTRNLPVACVMCSDLL